jgi:hypothetical protein
MLTNKFQLKTLAFQHYFYKSLQLESAPDIPVMDINTNLQIEK